MKKVTRYTSEEIKEMPLEAHAVNWDRVNSLTDEDITQAIADDPDAAPIWTKESLQQAKLSNSPPSEGWQAKPDGVVS